MQLDYIHNVNSYGDDMVRLYDFDKSQASKFRQSVEQAIIIDKQALDLATLDFIKSRNCKLTLRIADEDIGITSPDHIDFSCDMTIPGYEQMLVLMEPFCTKETKGHQWLYDIDSPTDFLFSPGGTW